MPEGPNPGPARRGRRDPQIAEAIQQIPHDEGLMQEAGDAQPEGMVGLFADDIVVAKVVHTVQFDGQDSWFTYGLSTRVQPGETEEEVYDRVSEIVNTRVLYMAAEAEDMINEMRDGVYSRSQERLNDQRRTRRIVPRENS